MNELPTMIEELSPELALDSSMSNTKGEPVTWTALGVVVAIIVLLVALAGWLYYLNFQISIASVEKSVSTLDKNTDNRLKSIEASLALIQQRLYAPKAVAKGIANPQIIVAKARLEETFSASYGSPILRGQLEINYVILRITADSVLLQSEVIFYRDGKSVFKAMGLRVEVPLNGNVTLLNQIEIFDKDHHPLYKTPVFAIAIVDRQSDQLVIATGESKKSIA